MLNGSYTERVGHSTQKIYITIARLMNHKYFAVLLYLITILLKFPAHAMDPDRKCLHAHIERIDPRLALHKKLLHNIQTCVESTQRYLEAKLQEQNHPPIALILDIDDTCILSKENIVNNIVINESVLKLAQWAVDQNIKIYYLSSRIAPLDSREQVETLAPPPSSTKPILDQLRKYKFPCQEGEIICYKNYQEFEKSSFDIGAWKQKKLRIIQKTFPVYAFLDNDPDNVDIHQKGQHILPSSEYSEFNDEANKEEYEKRKEQYARAVFDK